MWRLLLRSVLGLLAGTFVAAGAAILSAIVLAVLRLYIDGHGLSHRIPLGAEWVHHDRLHVHLSGYDLIVLATATIVWIGATWWWARNTMAWWQSRDRRR